MADQANPDNSEGQQSSSAKQELRQHELVDRLRPDPSQQQPLTVLSGFLGHSPQAGHWRLYLTPTLDDYVEIPEEDIVHSQSLGPEQSALGGTMIWVRSATPLQYTRTRSRQIQAEFLQGAITSGFRARATRFQATSVPGARNAQPQTYYCSDVYCFTDFCSTDVPRYCRTYYGCGGGGGGAVSDDAPCQIVSVDIC